MQSFVFGTIFIYSIYRLLKHSIIIKIKHLWMSLLFNWRIFFFVLELWHGIFLTVGHGTNCERVSGVSLGTHATDVMQGNLAESISAAQSCTGIGTSLPNAGLIAGTLAVHETFGSTGGRRAYELGHTGTGGFIVWRHCALGVWSTRWGFAWVLAGFHVLRFCFLTNVLIGLILFERYNMRTSAVQVPNIIKYYI